VATLVPRALRTVTAVAAPLAKSGIPTLETMTADQLDFPTIRDWREPQIVSASELTDLLAEATRAGHISLHLWGEHLIDDHA
jgi:hypothetical protein